MLPRLKKRKFDASFKSPLLKKRKLDHVNAEKELLLNASYEYDIQHRRTLSKQMQKMYFSRGCKIYANDKEHPSFPFTRFENHCDFDVLFTIYFTRIAINLKIPPHENLFYDYDNDDYFTNNGIEIDSDYEKEYDSDDDDDVDHNNVEYKGICDNTDFTVLNNNKHDNDDDDDDDIRGYDDICDNCGNCKECDLYNAFQKVGPTKLELLSSAPIECQIINDLDNYMAIQASDFDDIAYKNYALYTDLIHTILSFVYEYEYIKKLKTSKYYKGTKKKVTCPLKKSQYYNYQYFLSC